MNTSTGITVPLTVTATKSTVHSKASTYTPAYYECTMYLQWVFPPFIFDLFNGCLGFVSQLLNYCRGIFSRSDVNSEDFASRWRGRSLHLHTLWVFVVMRHGSRLTALFKKCTSVMNYHPFSRSPCWSADLFQSTNAL